MWTIQQLSAREILDSRGRPTVSAVCQLSSGAVACASVPSGASTGLAEALELRDGDAKRYRGLGCQKAVANVIGPIAQALVGRQLTSQAALDTALVELDATANKSRLGANAILAVSLAFARAVAMDRGVQLYEHFADILSQSSPSSSDDCAQGNPSQDTKGDFRGVRGRGFRGRGLTINLFSGGKHAGQQVAIQDVLVVPLSPTTIDGSLVMMYDIYQAAADLSLDRYGMRLLTADEGGQAPPFESAEEMLEMAVHAIRAAGYQPGRDAALAVDVAASHFYRDGLYHIEPEALDSTAMIQQIVRWLAHHPIISVEDGLAEDDWDHWPKLTAAIGRHTLVLGDDLLCTNPNRIRRAIDTQACNALLLKVNQIGTLTEAAQAYHLARSAGWHVTLSVRSGETEDDWVADLAVGWRADQFKNGSITQSERLAKYNRLLAIEAETSIPFMAQPAD